MENLPRRRPSRAEVGGRARAVWFSGPRLVQIRDEDVGQPGAGEVRIHAIRSAISPGTEMLVYRGQVDRNLALDLPTLKGSFGFPIKYGYANVGKVEAVGSGVSKLSKGDLVFVHHPHQSAYVVSETAPIVLPDSTDPEAGVLLANLETAVNIVLDARPQNGDRVAVLGLGVVGLLLTQVLRHAGVAVIAGIDPLAKRRHLATQVGADIAFEPEHAEQQVMETTKGAGIDLAIEVSGNPAALQRAIDLVRLNGTVVAASWYGTKPVTLNLGGAFHRNRIRIVSSQVSHIDPAHGPEWTFARRTARAVELLGQITWSPLITHRFSIENAAEAYRLLDERPDDAVQVVFTYV